MEKIAVLVVPVLLSWFLLRLLLKPISWGLRLALHSAAGLSCLTAFNMLSSFAGILIPVNAVTTLVAAFLGLPGITLLAALEML